MIERHLYEVLTESLQAIVQHPTQIDEIFRRRGLEEEELVRIRATVLRFAGREHPVIHNFARDDVQMPVWSIILAGEAEETRFLGDEAGFLGEDETDEPMSGEVLSSLFRSTYQILIYSEHPDVTLYLYTLAKAFVVSNRHEIMRRAQVLEVGPIGGADLAPDTEWLPANLFVRALSVGVLYEEQQPGPGQGLRIRSVTGIHVRDGTPDAGTGVRKLIDVENDE